MTTARLRVRLFSLAIKILLGGLLSLASSIVCYFHVIRDGIAFLRQGKITYQGLTQIDHVTRKDYTWKTTLQESLIATVYRGGAIPRAGAVNYVNGAQVPIELQPHQPPRWSKPAPPSSPIVSRDQETGVWREYYFEEWLVGCPIPFVGRRAYSTFVTVDAPWLSRGVITLDFGQRDSRGQLVQYIFDLFGFTKCVCFFSLAVGFIRLIYKHRWLRSANRRGLCTPCHYPLAGLPICPECGTPNLRATVPVAASSQSPPPSSSTEP